MRTFQLILLAWIYLDLTTQIEQLQRETVAPYFHEVESEYLGRGK
jgi:hypothetical protein